MADCNDTIPDTVSDTISLAEVVVLANYRPFKVTGPGSFVYNVSKDSTLRGAATIDALKKVPILNANNKGEVTAMNGTSLEFRLNGLRSPLLSNLSQVLTALPADAVASISFKSETNGEGQQIMVVNIITKGRLEGYRAQFTSSLTDASWKNGIWGMTKVRRLTLHGSYFNTLIWGHHSTSGSEEYRLNDPSLHRFVHRSYDKGYRTDLHNIEFGASYDVDDRSFITVYGSIMLKSNPRSSGYSQSHVYSSDGKLSLSYTGISDSHFSDSEYYTEVKYERNLGDTRHPGQLRLGYRYYNRPVATRANQEYEIGECDSLTFLSDINLNDSRLIVHKSYATHTAVGEWEKRLNKNMLASIYGRVRLREEAYDNDQSLTSPVYSESIRQEASTSLSEKFGILTPKAAYFTDWWEVRGGVVAQWYRHRVTATGLSNSITNTRFTLLPFVSAAILAKDQTLFELAYNTENMIPDITALDPYHDTSSPGNVRFGNPKLRPQTSHIVKLDISRRIGPLQTGMTLSASYIRDIILGYQYLDDAIVCHTFGNIANRRGASLAVYTSGRLHRNTYLRFNASLDWSQYRSSLLATDNNGWCTSLSGKVEQELPWNLTLDLSAWFASRPVMLQGRGASGFGYGISLYRQFLNRKLTLLLDASSFAPLWYRQKSTVSSLNYLATMWNRTFHSSFSLTIRYAFGLLNARTKNSSLNITDSEIKTGYNR